MENPECKEMEISSSKSDEFDQPTGHKSSSGCYEFHNSTRQIQFLPIRSDIDSSFNVEVDINNPKISHIQWIFRKCFPEKKNGKVLSLTYVDVKRKANNNKIPFNSYEKENSGIPCKQRYSIKVGINNVQVSQHFTTHHINFPTRAEYTIIKAIDIQLK